MRNKLIPFFVLLTLTMLHFSSGRCFSQVSKTTPAVPDADVKKIAVLIVDGQNNHGSWPQTTMMMRQYLVESGKFTVDIARTKFTNNGGDLLAKFPLNDGREYQDLPSPKSDPEFAPDFSKYGVVICNFGYGAAPWPDETKASFVQFMQNGGGLVTVHAADNCFPEWPEYNQMIGLGGWGNRNENSGPYVYYNEAGQVVRDVSNGPGGSHGSQHEFSIVMRDDQHPIVAGLPGEFLHSQDELYDRLRGPAENMKILATAFASPKEGGSGRHEPMLMTVEFGKGRIFHSTLGHADYSMECVGFITTLLRGTEWAATGKVTIDVPADFPTADKSSARKFKLAESVADPRE